LSEKNKLLFFFRRFLGVLKELMPFTSGAGGYNGLISQMLRKTPLLTVYQWINLRGNWQETMVSAPLPPQLVRDFLQIFP